MLRAHTDIFSASADGSHSACTDMLERAYCLALSTFLGAFCFRKHFSVSAPCAERARAHTDISLGQHTCIPCCLPHGSACRVHPCAARTASTHGYHSACTDMLVRSNCFGAIFLLHWSFRRLFVNCRGTRSYSNGNDHTSPNSPRRHRLWAYQITNPKQ